MQSDNINELAAALSKAQGEFTAIPKGELNPFFKSKYAGLPDVVRVAAPILSANGLSISQFIVQNEVGEDCLKTYLLHSSGQFIENSMKMHLGKLDSQGQGSAVTYARRYSYMAVLGLVADEDDDGNRASHGSRDQGESRVVESKDPRVLTILANEGNGNSFVDDIAAKIKKGYTMSEAQLDKASEAATKPNASRRGISPEESVRQAQLLKTIKGMTEDQQAELSSLWDENGLPSAKSGMNDSQLEKAEKLLAFILNPTAA